MMEVMLKRNNMDTGDDDRGTKTGRTAMGKGGASQQQGSGAASASQGRTHRQKSQARQQHNGDEFEIKTNDPGLKKLLVVMLKQQLKTTQDMRKVKHSVFDAFHGRIEHPLLKAIGKERERYVQFQQAMDKDQQLEYGPGVPMFKELLRNVVTMDIGAANKKELEKLRDQLEQADENLEEMFSGMYFEKMKEATMVRILIGMQHLPQRRIIIQSLKQLDFKHMAGCPPPGYMENQLSAALEQLEL